MRGKIHTNLSQTLQKTAHPETLFRVDTEGGTHKIIWCLWTLGNNHNYSSHCLPPLSLKCIHSPQKGHKGLLCDPPFLVQNFKNKPEYGGEDDFHLDSFQSPLNSEQAGCHSDIVMWLFVLMRVSNGAHGLGATLGGTWDSCWHQTQGPTHTAHALAFELIPLKKDKYNWANSV